MAHHAGVQLIKSLIYLTPRVADRGLGWGSTHKIPDILVVIKNGHVGVLGFNS